MCVQFDAHKLIESGAAVFAREIATSERILPTTTTLEPPPTPPDNTTAQPDDVEYGDEEGVRKRERKKGAGGRKGIVQCATCLSKVYRRQRIAKGERLNAKTALYTTETALTNKISWNRIVLHHSKTFLENHQDGDLLCTYVLHKCS